MGMSAVALAEEALLKGDARQARYHAGKAEKLLPRGSIGWLQAQDILQAAKKKE
jgi:predicted Zn-dependent protease